MGKTFRRNDRFKKDRRDKNFRESKKFKEFQQGPPVRQIVAPIIEEPRYDVIDDNS